jgi:hypothetical protein
MKTKIPVIIFFTAFIIGITSLTFATERMNLVKVGTVSIEKNPSVSVRFYNISVYQEGNATVIAGRFKRRGHRYISPGFIKISLIGPSGNAQEEIITVYKPRYLKRKSKFGSRFEVRLQFIAQQGSNVRLSFQRTL